MPGLTTHRRPLLSAAALVGVALACALVWPRALLRGAAEPDPDTAEQGPVTIEADYSQEWSEGRDQIALLRGRCRIVQGETTLSADKVVVWRRAEETGRSQRDRLLVYLEDRVRLERPGESLSEPSLLVNLSTEEGVIFAVQHRATDSPATDDALFQRGKDHLPRRGALLPTQLAVPPGPLDGPSIPGVQVNPGPTGMRRIRFFPRSLVPFQVESFPSTETTPPEQVIVITGGVTVLVDGVAGFGMVDLSADRIVVWTRRDTTDDFSPEIVQSSDTPLTMYLEGNIVIRQGLHLVKASQAVYDARDDRALILDADLRTFIPAIQDDIRIRAQRMRQLSQNSFYAQNAWVTASDFGRPGYRLQASDVFMEQRFVEPLFGPRRIDPSTGAPLVEQVPWVTSLNNTLFIEEVPVAYLPRVSGPAEDPKIPLRRATAGYDRIFGFQVRTVWDATQVFGLDEPPGTRWDLMLDYLSDRGPAMGTGGVWRGADALGIPGTYDGSGLAWYIHDDGVDNLGLDRRALPPEEQDRYLARIRHRQRMPYNVELIAELGLVSDRNFMEQYFEADWDRDKDVENLLYLKQHFGSAAWTALVEPQLNDFYTETEWLPRGDFYILGQPFLGGALAYYTHSEAGYARLNPEARPEFPLLDPQRPVPYWADVEGEVLMTRHELDAPFSLGPVKVVPYALGEAAHWGEGLDGEPVDRLVGSLGVRSSLMFWRVFPFVQSRIFNLNGLAHKVLWEAEYAFTEATAGIDEIPQYHEIDENAQQRFRTRYPIHSFPFAGPGFPPEFDPRLYAIRTGAGLPVAAPWFELVEDQQVVRLGLRQRLQTKVGPPERLRIKDWMTLDLQASFFPRPERDNFGEEVGLLSARYAWNVGDRTQLFADALYDVFDGGQELWDVGVMTQRGRRGMFAAALHQVKGGPFDSQIATASYSYQMSPKWLSTAGTAYDLGENRDIGQTFAVTRIGADWLVHVGATFDASKNNAGLAFSIEPRLGALTPTPALMRSLLGGM